MLTSIDQGRARMDRIARRRAAYAAEITRRFNVADARIERAFATVPREHFAGRGPWLIGGGGIRLPTPDADPARLYDDVLVAIDAGRSINNGQPSLHAISIEALKLEEGDTVVQIGAGAGYYSAILAELVGSTGRVIAYEIEPDIAERARANLADRPQAEVRPRSGVGEPLPAADAVYVNASATQPPKTWIEALKPGGRLVFPLQAPRSVGAMLLLTRSKGGGAWGARFVLSRTMFISCEGAQDPAMGRRLDEAFERGGAERVRSFWLSGAPDGTVWVQGEGWALSTAEPG